MKLSKSTLSILILAILYLVGILGVRLNIHEDFLLLTPFNLLSSLALVLWNHPKWDTFTKVYLIICFCVGFLAEVIGVQTGLIFGSYHYGPVLGWQLWDTPLMIGVNWALLAYCSGVVVSSLVPHWHWIIKGTLSALLMVGLDVLIEPVAIRYDFWTWEQHAPPLQNFIGWFLVALPLLLLFHYQFKKINNKVAIALFIMQIIFFASL